MVSSGSLTGLIFIVLHCFLRKIENSPEELLSSFGTNIAMLSSLLNLVVQKSFIQHFSQEQNFSGICGHLQFNSDMKLIRDCTKFSSIAYGCIGLFCIAIKRFERTSINDNLSAIGMRLLAQSGLIYIFAKYCQKQYRKSRSVERK